MSDELSRANQALKTVGLGNDAISEIPITTYLWIFGPAILILILCTILFVKDETVSKSTVTALQVIDVIAVAVLLYGLTTLFTTLGRYVISHTKM